VFAGAASTLGVTSARSGPRRTARCSSRFFRQNDRAQSASCATRLSSRATRMLNRCPSAAQPPFADALMTKRGSHGSPPSAPRCALLKLIHVISYRAPERVSWRV
jgi:hypothetical protein